MYIPLLMSALAGMITASPFSTAPNANTTMTTVVKTQITTLTGLAPAAPSLSKRWEGDCEEYCSHLWGNGYYPCMELCVKREGSSTDTEHPEDSDFVKPGEAPWEYVTTDSPSTSDQTDYHHKRELTATNASDSDDDGELGGIYTDKEELKAHVEHILKTVRAYGFTYHEVIEVHNSVRLPSDPNHVPKPIGKDVDEWIQNWLVGMRNTIDRDEDTNAWAEYFVQYVLESKKATAQYYARRLEVLARKDTEKEMKELVKPLSKKAKKSIRREIRAAWMQQFGERVWGPKNVMAAVDFE